MTTRLRRTLRALVACLAALSVLGAASPADAYEGFDEWFITHKLELDIDGSYVPVALKCKGTSSILWYGPGAADDVLWTNVKSDGQGGVTHGVKAMTVPLTATPVPGDFDNDYCDDVFFYGPGAGADETWYFNSDGSHVAKPANIGGSFRPLAGKFDSTLGTDIFFYGPGGAKERVWSGQPNDTFVVKTSPQIGGDYQIASAAGYEGVMFYASTADTVIWLDRFAGKANSSAQYTASFHFLGGLDVADSFSLDELADGTILRAPNGATDYMFISFDIPVPGQMVLYMEPGQLDDAVTIGSTWNLPGYSVLHGPGPAPDSIWMANDAL